MEKSDIEQLIWDCVTDDPNYQSRAVENLAELIAEMDKRIRELEARAN